MFCVTLQFIPNYSLLECQKFLFTWYRSCRFAPFCRTKIEITTNQWHHIRIAPKNTVVHFFSRRINTGFWEHTMPVCHTHHSLPLDYKVIKETVSHSSTGNLQEIKAAFQNSPHTQETASKERKMTESKCHQAKVADLDPCS